MTLLLVKNLGEAWGEVAVAALGQPDASARLPARATNPRLLDRQTTARIPDRGTTPRAMDR